MWEEKYRHKDHLCDLFWERDRIDGNKVGRMEMGRKHHINMPWVGVSLFSSSLLSATSFLCYTKASWAPGCTLRRFHPTLGAAALKVWNTSLDSEISINSPVLLQLCSMWHFARENEYHHELGRASHWHLLLPTERETSLYSPTTRTRQDKAEWNTKLIALLLLLSH